MNKTYYLKANLKNSENNDSDYIGGIIMDENGTILGEHFSSTLNWLEYDLLNKVPFDNTDTYFKNW